MNYYPSELKRKFEDLKFALEKENWSNISLKANGGNTILFIYETNYESLYFERIEEELKEIEVINLAELLVEFIDDMGLSDFELLWNEYNQDSYQLFRSQNNNKDFYNKITHRILKASDNDKIPILIRTGILFGTSIDNHFIMEDKRIRELKKPLVIFYPGALKKDDNLYFLNFKLASKYRSLIIN